MADLKSLIRVRKHELDEMQKALGELNAQANAVIQAKEDLAAQVEKEKHEATVNGEVGFAYTNFLKASKARDKKMDNQLALIEEQIEHARDEIAEAYAELKKIEKTQENRDARAAKAIQKKEDAELDAIGLENHRRKED